MRESKKLTQSHVEIITLELKTQVSHTKQSIPFPKIKSLGLILAQVSPQSISKCGESRFSRTEKMTKVSPLHTPDFTITLDMELYQTPLNTPFENISRSGISATVVSETHQCNETTDKPNFISFLSATQANATDSSQDSDPSFPKELDDLIFESPNISTPTPTQLPECLQVPSTAQMNRQKLKDRSSKK